MSAGARRVWPTKRAEAATRRRRFWDAALRGYVVYFIAVSLECGLISLLAFWVLPDPIDSLVAAILMCLAALGTAVYLFLRTSRSCP